MNLTQLLAAVQAKGYTTDTAAQQTIFLNEVYHEVCGMNRWPFLEAQDKSVSTVAGTDNYTLPFNWRNLDAVRLEVTAIQQFTQMKYLSPQEFRDYQHVDRDVSAPFYWTFINQKLQLWPVPDQAYTVTVDYIQNPADLAAGADVPVLPVLYHDLLVWGAIQSICFRERDWLGREFAQGKFEEMLKRMQEEFLIRQRQTSSHVKKSGYWSTQVPFPFVNDGF